MVREVHIPHLGRTVKLGRRAPIAPVPRLHLRNYLRGTLPTPPDNFSYAPLANPAISNIYENDQLGDCVIACMQHAEGVFTANTGATPMLFSDSETVENYSAIGGYVPGDPSTDQGCDIDTALNYWQHNGLAGGDKITAWLDVDPTNPAEYSAALYLFENLVYGIGLPDAWLADPQPGQTWDAARPDPNNGHCILGVGRKPGAVLCATWGFTIWLTDAAHARDVDQLRVVLSADVIACAAQKAPNGLNWAQLIADWDSIGGNVPSPGPAPSPTPNPPTPSPTPNKLSRGGAALAQFAPVFGVKVNMPVSTQDVASFS